MIVDPDFFDHWKTLLLIDELDGDTASPVYILRLWAHCQNRRQWCFDSLSEKALKALCRYPGHPSKLLAGLTSSGFVRVEDSGELIVIGWDEYNAQLIANWNNGKRGGRPKGSTKKPKLVLGSDSANPNKPMGNPTETHQEPIGEDRRGLDKSNSLSPPRKRLEKTDDPAPHPTWADQWQKWIESWEGREGRTLDPIKAQMQLGELLAKDPDKAKRDLEFSLRGYWKSIRDSDDDWSKTKRPGGSSTKEKLGI